MKVYCLALDLKNDPALIAEYKRYHEPGHIWPEVIKNIRERGILREEIFLLGTRMVMVLHTTEDFSFEDADAIGRANSRMQEWETLMWKYQQPLPQAKSGEKWVLMEKIFEV